MGRENVEDKRITRDMLDVLIVDDIEDICSGICSLINRMYFAELGTIYTTTDSLDALKIADEIKPDIVITDIKMPGMKGLGLIKRIKNFSPTTSFIVISGYSDYEYIRESFKLGAIDYLLKPVGFMELKRQLNIIIDKKLNRETVDEVMSTVDVLKKFVWQNYHYPDPLRKAAQNLRMNYNYLSYLFKKKTGSCFKQFLTEVRMNEAFELLKDPTIRVCEIAWKIGYTQPQHFSRAFKRYTGVSPAKYRKVQG